ncbi:hypothetical protein ACFLZZ_01255 [Nanoarchaeota archaeon]
MEKKSKLEMICDNIIPIVGVLSICGRVGKVIAYHTKGVSKKELCKKVAKTIYESVLDVGYLYEMSKGFTPKRRKRYKGMQDLYDFCIEGEEE